MAKKYYLVSKFETKEDFDKHFDRIYHSGYEQGYKEGMEEAVSYIFELLDHFGCGMQQSAARMNGKRKEQAAMKNYELGIRPYVPKDPAIREAENEWHRQTLFKNVLKEVRKEDKES